MGFRESDNLESREKNTENKEKQTLWILKLNFKIIIYDAFSLTF